MKSSTFYEYNGPFYSKGIFKVRGNYEHIIGISPSAVWKRTDKGMDIVTAITKPSRKWRYWE